MFYKSYTKSEARAFDHLYDPIYTTGDYQRDIQRENVNALTNTAPVNIYTNFNSMFSELSQRPRTFNVLQRNQLPTKAPNFNGKHERRHYPPFAVTFSLSQKYTSIIFFSFFLSTL